MASFRMLIPQLVFCVNSLDGYIKPLEVMFSRNRKISVVISKEESIFTDLSESYISIQYIYTNASRCVRDE